MLPIVTFGEERRVVPIAYCRYETFVKDTNGSIEEKNRDITNKSSEKATAEADKTASEEAKETAMNEQQQNKNEEADLHKSCDFVTGAMQVDCLLKKRNGTRECWAGLNFKLPVATSCRPLFTPLF